MEYFYFATFGIDVADLIVTMAVLCISMRVMCDLIFYDQRTFLLAARIPPGVVSIDINILQFI